MRENNKVTGGGMFCRLSHTVEGTLALCGKININVRELRL
jgi:hypothetical protein